MPGLPPEYYRDYDFLHSEKDYETEVNTVLQIGENITGNTPTDILEIGCGTGNHTQRFASRSLEVTGVDTDPKMTSIAQGKSIPGTTIVHGTAGKAPDRSYDIACAMFNVVNYIDEESHLSATFRDVRKRLSTSGVFIFDCWNGEAVKKDPPADFMRNIRESDADWLEVSATGRLDDAQDYAIIKYKTDGVRHGQPTSYFYTLRSRLWPISMIKDTLLSAGFKDVSVLEWMNPNSIANSDSWRIMLTARAK